MKNNINTKRKFQIIKATLPQVLIRSMTARVAYTSWTLKFCITEKLLLKACFYVEVSNALDDGEETLKNIWKWLKRINTEYTHLISSSCSRKCHWFNGLTCIKLFKSHSF
jgi:hypothetical protein